MKNLIQLLIIIRILTLGIPCFATCSVEALQKGMDEAFINSLKDKTLNQKTRVAYFPFQDGSSAEADSTLEDLFPIIFHMLTSIIDPNLGYHPFVTFVTGKSLGLQSKDYFNDEKILQAAESIKATHAVYGMFQKQPQGGLRYFVRIMTVNQKISNAPMEYVSEQEGRFFGIAVESLQAILKVITGKSPNSKSFTGFLKNAPTFESMRFYAKGMEQSSSYHEINLSIGKVWFEKSFTLSYLFKKSLEGKVRTLLMLALLAKQQGKDFSLLVQEASQTVREFGLSASSPTIFRWMDGHIAFASAMSFYEGNKMQDAITQLKKTVSLLPEDGIAHHYLSKTSDARSGEEATLARQINPCIETGN